MRYSNTSNDLSFSSRHVFSCIRTCDFRKKFASPDPRVDFHALSASIVLSGRGVSENSRSSYLRRVFGSGTVISLMAAKPLDYYSKLI